MMSIKGLLKRAVTIREQMEGQVEMWQEEIDDLQFWPVVKEREPKRRKLEADIEKVEEAISNMADVESSLETN